MTLESTRRKRLKKIIPFKKKTESDIPPLKLTFYNSTTKEQVELYTNYMLHLEKYGFGWEDTSLKFKYSVRLSTDKKGLIKKSNNKYGKKIRKNYF